MRFQKHITLTFLLGILAVGIAPRPAVAQNTDDALVTAALGVPGDEDGDTDPAVYITWWPTGDLEWTSSRYAVYSKEGRPSDSGSFELASVIEPSTDELSVAQLVERSKRLGADRSKLSNNIDGLFDEIVPTEGMSLAEKLAAIVEVAQDDPESAENLQLLTRRHPAAALAAGIGFIDSIPKGDIRTYEIRRCPEGADPADCGEVTGRVVVEGGAVKPLPAPGRPIEVPFVDDDGNEDPRGNLNAPLRWATPDKLRERGLHRFGYDLYRVDGELGQKEGWDSSAPDRDEFLEAIEKAPDQIQRVNDLPILPDDDLDVNEARDTDADPDTYFIIDDNDRYAEDGEPFEDGDQFVYIVAARDLLGRIGEPSVGALVTICHRLPPQAPRNVQVQNHYTWDANDDTQTQVFKVSWDKAEPRDDGPGIKEYWIYRWASIDQLQDKQGLPLSTVPSDEMTGGRIATISADKTEYVDDADTHPFITYTRDGDLENAPVVDQDEAGKTYWYTVRAVDKSACDANVSGNSAPAYGVLRDRVGPDQPSGGVTGDCLLFAPEAKSTTVESSDETYNDELVYLRLSAKRTDDRIAWVEFYTDPLDDERAFIGRFKFGEEKDVVEKHVRIRKDRLEENEISDQAEIHARFGTADGRESEFVTNNFAPSLTPSPKQEDNFLQHVPFTAGVEEASCDDRHEPIDPQDPDGPVRPVDIEIELTEGTEEWKLYRRVDSGPLTLIDQGTDSYEDDPTLNAEDVNLPLNGGRVCYFLQVFDRHGNPSSFSRLGCVESEPRTELQAPMLAPIQPLGEEPENGGARIGWFSPPDGVERFELRIRAAEDRLPAPEISDDLRPFTPPDPYDDPFFSIRSGIDDPENTTRAYITGRVGANFGEGPDFKLDWDKNFEPGVEYFVRVRAIGSGGAKGPWSNEESFVWASETDFSEPFDEEDCVVPWPVRGTPDVDSAFPVASTQPEGIARGLKAAILPQNPDGSIAYNGGAVRVGLVRTEELDVNYSENWDRLPGNSEEGLFQLPRSGETKETNLSEAFYARQNGESLLNFALYRYEVPTDERSEVSGDVHQVSPLIDGIANTPIKYQDLPAFAIHDPYVFPVATEKGAPTYHLYVKDTQPVVSGAKYRYLVVRFDDAGEIAQVIPLPTVTAN